MQNFSLQGRLSKSSVWNKRRGTLINFGAFFAAIEGQVDWPLEAAIFASVFGKEEVGMWTENSNFCPFAG